jgi:hypothetical protein
MSNLQIAESVDARTARLLKEESWAQFLDDPRVNGQKIVGFDPLKTNVIAVLGKPEVDNTSRAKQEIINEWVYGANIVTDDGDIFYAKAAVSEAQGVNEDFENGNFVLQNPGIQDTPAKSDVYVNITTPIAATLKAFVATPNYPLRNDSDPDNTGAGVDVVTYLVSYTTSDFNANGINGGAILDDLTTPATSAKLLTHFQLTSFNKTASDTLKVFVNHTMNGV